MDDDDDEGVVLGIITAAAAAAAAAPAPAGRCHYILGINHKIIMIKKTAGPAAQLGGRIRVQPESPTLLSSRFSKNVVGDIFCGVSF
jgi:hypothetical protein